MSSNIFLTFLHLPLDKIIFVIKLEKSIKFLNLQTVAAIIQNGKISTKVKTKN